MCGMIAHRYKVTLIRESKMMIADENQNVGSHI